MAQDLPITSYALLGLLTFGDELTGYELKQRADMTLRFYWTAPAMSQVYTELERLQGERMVARTGSAKPARYRITAKGRRRLESWMEHAPAGFPVLKHPVALRLLMGHLTDTEATRQLLRDYLEELAAHRTDLATVRSSLEGRDGAGEAFRYPALVAEWGLAYFDSEAEIARRVLGELDD